MVHLKQGLHMLTWLGRLFAYSPRRSPPITRQNRNRVRLQLEQLEQREVPAATAGFQLVNDWGAGYQAAMSIANDASPAISNWVIEFDFASNITQIWNATIVSRVGDHYQIKHASWNGTIGSNSKVDFGFLGTAGNLTVRPTNYLVNGIPLSGAPSLPTLAIAGASVTESDGQNVAATFKVTLSKASTSPITVVYSSSDGGAKAGVDYNAVSGTLTFNPGETAKTITVNVLGDWLDEANEEFSIKLSNPAGATLATAEAKGTIVDNDPLPSLSISDVTVWEPSSTTNASGYFSTSGNQIVDGSGQSVRIAGVNWFGFESTNYAPHGLWARGYKEMMDQMQQLGFNTIRLPFSNQLFDAGSTPSGIDFSKNPDLQGLSGIQIMDKIVAYAGQIGLRVILDHHRSGAGAGAEDSGLWYTGAYSEARWISDWQMLATRYANNPTVIGADLHNEPHGPATWGTGGANDWRLAAERAGNAILSVNSNWLIIVEGVESGTSGWYWWGGNLSNAGAHPVRLNVGGRLVYSPHDYPASVYPQSWFGASNYPNNLYSIWDSNWGYLFRQGIAPILIGEFGSKLETTSDQLWLNALVTYLKGDLNGDGVSDLSAGQQGASWTYWSWNPNSSDTGGILKDDWSGVQQAKVNALIPVQFSFGNSPGTITATFTVSLSAPSGQPVTVNWSTVNGTATSGADYVFATGTIAFVPGETTKTISITILGDSLIEMPETFFVRLSNPLFAILSDAEGCGTIQNV